jgi:class 3 adenylate cyclase
MPPEQAAAFVQQFLTPQVECIERRRGFIDKFIGDGVMAYWVVSSRKGQEECEAALSAAEESIRILSAIKLGSKSITIRVGLHIGRVSLGNFGTPARSQFTIIGKEVNKASRLESAKAPDLVTGGPLGFIRASEEFYAALSEQGKAQLPVTAKFIGRNIGEVLGYTSQIIDPSQYQQ